MREHGQLYKKRAYRMKACKLLIEIHYMSDHTAVYAEYLTRYV